jgi:WD40 repeat protein
MKKGGILKTINCKSEVTYCVEWSKDEKYLATTEMDGTLNIYDTKTWDLLATAPGDQPTESRAYGCDLDFASMPGRIFVATE